MLARFFRKSLPKHEQEKLKILLSKVSKNFEDCISFEIPNEVVFTPYGHFYDFLSISEFLITNNKFCPQTTLYLNEDIFLNGPIITKLENLFQELKKDFDATSQLIEKKSDKKLIGDKFHAFSKKVCEYYEPEIEKCLNEIRKVNSFKMATKLYSYLPSHLLSWKVQSSGAGVTQLKDYEGKTYFIPNTVVELMKIAQQPFENADQLIEEVIAKAKSFNQPGLFKNILNAEAMLTPSKDEKKQTLCLSR